MPQMHTCTRVYNNGQRVTVQRDEEAVHEWEHYNRICRPGTALFIDGQCVQRGYLDKERVRALELELAPVRATVAVPDSSFLRRRL